MRFGGPSSIGRTGGALAKGSGGDRGRISSSNPSVASYCSRARRVRLSSGTRPEARRGEPDSLGQTRTSHVLCRRRHLCRADQKPPLASQASPCKQTTLQAPQWSGSFIESTLQSTPLQQIIPGSLQVGQLPVPPELLPLLLLLPPTPLLLPPIGPLNDASAQAAAPGVP